MKMGTIGKRLFACLAAQANLQRAAAGERPSVVSAEPFDES
jgi:hypothetical protein